MQVTLADRLQDSHGTVHGDICTQSVSSRAHTPQLGEACCAGTRMQSVPRQCSGSPVNPFLVIALSFLVFRSLPLGLLKVPQWGLGCGPELDKFPIILAELLQLGPARTQP